MAIVGRLSAADFVKRMVQTRRARDKIRSKKIKTEDGIAALKTAKEEHEQSQRRA